MALPSTQATCPSLTALSAFLQAALSGPDDSEYVQAWLALVRRPLHLSLANTHRDAGGQPLAGRMRGEQSRVVPADGSRARHQGWEVTAGSSRLVCCRSRPQGQITIQSGSEATSASWLMAKEAGAPCPGPLQQVCKAKQRGDLVCRAVLHGSP